LALNSHDLNTIRGLLLVAWDIASCTPHPIVKAVIATVQINISS
jgi:hypothetical protein